MFCDSMVQNPEPVAHTLVRSWQKVAVEDCEATKLGTREEGSHAGVFRSESPLSSSIDSEIKIIRIY
jgi:hypothetical protein